MTEEERIDELRRLKNQANMLFAYDETLEPSERPDLEDKRVIAAIVTAANAMCIASDLSQLKQATNDMLLEAFGAANDEEVNKLIGMGPQYVGAIIPFKVDFNDYGAARTAYEARQYDYDSMFRQANYLEQTKENTNQR